MAFASVSGIGVIALLILLRHVPRALSMPNPQGLTQELAVLRNRAMWRGLLLTVIGFAGVFTLYTYIEPLLTQITGMDNRMIALTLLLFGAGLALGNHAGGKLADRFGVQRALWVSLTTLMLVLIAGRWMFASTPLAIAFVLLLGIAAFATVAPLQMGVLQSAGEAGMNLASSLNIAAFNLGNALGAWLGGAVIAQGLGLTSLAWAAALPAAAALLMASLAPHRASSGQSPAMAAGMH